MTTCPVCSAPTPTPALAFLHEIVHGAPWHEPLKCLPYAHFLAVSEAMEAYAAQAVAERNAEVARVLREYGSISRTQCNCTQCAAEELAQRLGVEL